MNKCVGQNATRQRTQRTPVAIQCGAVRARVSPLQVNDDHCGKLKQLFSLRNPAALPGDDDTAVRARRIPSEHESTPIPPWP